LQLKSEARQFQATRRMLADQSLAFQGDNLDHCSNTVTRHAQAGLQQTS
jgi:hypothetical protein